MRLRSMFLIFGVVFARLAWPDVYVRTDAQGVTHYTNRPGLNGYALVVRVLREKGANNLAKASPVPKNVVRFAPQIDQASRKFKVDRALLSAVIATESGYNPRAVSSAGAQGLMQLMPDTAKRYRVSDVFDPAQNIRAGAHYLHDLLVRFHGDLTLALAAYNAGASAVVKHGLKIPPYTETHNYVPKVIDLYNKLANQEL